MSRCAYCEDGEGDYTVSYWNNDQLAYPISVQVCRGCLTLLKERGLISDDDVIPDRPPRYTGPEPENDPEADKWICLGCGLTTDLDSRAEEMGADGHDMAIHPEVA